MQRYVNKMQKRIFITPVNCAMAHRKQQKKWWQHLWLKCRLLRNYY